jgi:formate-dependent nitrite reductase membrane component NrfD
MMPLLKSIFFGFATAVLASVLWIVVKLVLPIAVPYLLARFRDDGGIGGGTAYITSGSILLVAIIGFIGGFLWRLRRRPRHA